ECNDNVETRFNRLARNYDGSGMDSKKPNLFPRMGCSLGSGEISTLTFSFWILSHRCVLFNCPAIKQYLKYFLIFYVACREHQ
ncbi:hypothetical protein QUC31_001173, partial [Theobroma cacao]